MTCSNKFIQPEVRVRYSRLDISRITVYWTKLRMVSWTPHVPSHGFPDWVESRVLNRVVCTWYFPKGATAWSIVPSGFPPIGGLVQTPLSGVATGVCTCTVYIKKCQKLSGC